MRNDVAISTVVIIIIAVIVIIIAVLLSANLHESGKGGINVLSNITNKTKQDLLKNG